MNLTEKRLPAIEFGPEWSLIGKPGESIKSRSVGLQIKLALLNLVRTTVAAGIYRGFGSCRAFSGLQNLS
jgi:hypothetical protein